MGKRTTWTHEDMTTLYALQAESDEIGRRLRKLQVKYGIVTREARKAAAARRKRAKGKSGGRS